MDRIVFKDGILKQTEDGEVLRAMRCRSCGEIVFPAEDMCYRCLSEDMEEITLSKKGKLYSFTVLYRPVNRFPVPHAVGYVDLPEKIRIFTPLVIDDPASLEKGYEFKNDSEVEMVIDTLWTEEDGTEVYGYKFRVCRLPESEQTSCET